MLGLAIAAAVAAAITGACRDRPPHDRHAGSGEEAARRRAALASARVWAAPRTDPGAADFSRNTAGPGYIDAASDIDCDFSLDPVHGTTPKFHCTLPDGDRVKVKYGAANPEVPAQVAASRLLAALGFFVDRVMLVHSVRCRGCPPFPHQALECLKHGIPRALCLQGTPASRVRAFEPATIERRFDGEAIESDDEEGWAWYELDAVDARAGGSTRAQVDALRLMAVLLAHWDNKPVNQRLVCPPGADRPDGSCRAPAAVLHDLGGTFGPMKADLENWQHVPMWEDAAACRVGLSTLPFNGATFRPADISEEGRQLALKLLRPIGAPQLNTLFDASGVARFPHVLAAARRPEAWTEAFLAKVAQIEAAGPCPST